jgi:TonB family protein
VREPRRASGAEARSDVVAGGPVARRRAQGDGAEAHGPGDGGRGRGTAGAGSAQNALYNDYLRDSMSRIQRHWSFPRELIYALRQGIVYLVVRVAPDGRIRRVTVRRSSGYEQFDAYAIRAVREANPLAPPPPQELFRRGSSYLDLPLEMRYRNPMFE